MMVLSGLDAADFNFLLTSLSLTRGNLSRHIEKLESASYLEVKKSFRGKMPNTSYQVTQKGAEALAQYWQKLDEVRQLGLS